MKETHTRSAYESESGFRARFVETDGSGKRAGLYVEYFDSGAISVVGQYRNGHSCGVWTHFSEDGNVMQCGLMSEHGWEGEWRRFLPNGRVWERVTYKCGLEHGLYEQFDEEGRCIARGEFRNGRAWNGTCAELVLEKQPDGGYSRLGVFKEGRRISDV